MLIVLRRGWKPPLSVLGGFGNTILDVVELRLDGDLGFQRSRSWTEQAGSFRALLPHEQCGLIASGPTASPDGLGSGGPLCASKLNFAVCHSGDPICNF